MGRDFSAATRLRKNKSRILEVWARIAGKKLPAARAQPHATLLDSLPDFLDNLADTLADPSPDKALARREQHLANEHGRERAQLEEYDLEHIIDEYQILRQVMFDVLEEEAPLQHEERDLILNAVQIAVRNASSQFYHLHLSRSDLIEVALKRSYVELDQKVQQHTQELNRAREFLRVLVENAEDYAIFTLDPNGFVRTWNYGAAIIKLYKPAEIIGRHFEVLYPEDARQRNEPMDHLRQALERGKYRGEGVRVKKGGEPFLADVSITPLFDGKSLVGFGKIVSDLTHRHKLIQERDLSRSKVLTLESEQRLRERFVASLSHDLRTPLTAAKSAVQLLERTKGNPANFVQLCKRIQRNINRADLMIQNFLDANRIKAGQKLPLKIQHFNLNHTVRKAVEELKSIYGDRFVLKANENIDGFWDERERLFDPFVRSQSAESGPQPGWGIGLTLVKGVAEAHGGRVRVESVETEGTTFKVDLPRDSRSGQKDLSTAV